MGKPRIDQTCKIKNHLRPVIQLTDGDNYICFTGNESSNRVFMLAVGWYVSKWDSLPQSQLE
jgi:hypothetical protein